MCRSQKAGVKRCKGAVQSHALISASVRKKVAYRAEKVGISSEEWKAQNPEMLVKITAASEKKVTFKQSCLAAEATEKQDELTPANIANLEASLLQSPEELRSWNPNIPVNLEEHIKTSSESMNHLTVEEKQAIELYRGHAYEEINGALTGRSKVRFNRYYPAGHWKTSTTKTYFHDFDDFKEYVSHMDNALSKRQAESRVIYRGVSPTGAFKIASNTSGSQVSDPTYGSSKENTDNIKAAVMSQYAPGTEIQFDGYASTSLDPKVAAVWAGAGHGKPTILYEIQTSLGSDCTGISDFGGADEREVILPRSSRFKVVNVYTDTKYSYETAQEGKKETATYTDGSTVIVQLVEVSADGNPINAAEPFKVDEITEEILADRMETPAMRH